MIKINFNSPDPIYKQLVHEIKNLIESNELKEGDSLPTIRSLASQIDIAINTVARAYKELEGLNLIESNGRRGSYVKRKHLNNTGDDVKIFKKSILELLQKGNDKKDIEQIFRDNLNYFFE